MSRKRRNEGQRKKRQRLGSGDFNIPAIALNAGKPTTLTIAGIAELSKQAPADENRPRIQRKEAARLTK